MCLFLLPFQHYFVNLRTNSAHKANEDYQEA